MNWDVVAGKWRELGGKARTKWGKLTDDDIHVIGGKKDELIGRLQKRYGYERDQAERETEKHVLRVDAQLAQIAPGQTGARVGTGICRRHVIDARHPEPPLRSREPPDRQ